MTVLKEIKKLISLHPDDTSFDTDLIIFINGALNTLHQMGLNEITINETTPWEDITNNDPKLEIIKTYIFLKVKLIFDPPISSILMDAYKKQLDELTWRITNLSFSGTSS